MALLETGQCLAALRAPNPRPLRGRVAEVIGLTISAWGPAANLGDICHLINPHSGERTLAEVVGFRDGKTILVPLDEPIGVRPGWEVRGTDRPLTIPEGSNLLGRVLDGLGRPIDDGGSLAHLPRRPVNGTSPNPLKRQMVDQPIGVGVRAIDALLTCGRGQRVGLFAGSGVGKSTLLGMIARGASADCNVIALIGERGREVREFLERDLGPEGLARSVVVVATGDQPPMVRLKAALAATAIAEDLRDQGKHVMLMMDSVTRLALAQREIGLSAGEPPTSRGYTPSVFFLLPRLLERAGNGERGSITAFYTVLVDGDDMNEPIADTVRGILDGHIVLHRRLANRGHFPAIDVLQSVSRVMGEVTTAEHREAAQAFRRYLAAYEEVRELVQAGAYQPGINRLTDVAVQRIGDLNDFLRQEPHVTTTADQAHRQLLQLMGGLQ